MRIYILLGILLFSAPLSYAQTLGSQLNDQEAIVLSPEFPMPGEQVTATLNNYSSFLSGASIEWSIDGVVIPEASNFREVTFVAGEAGKTMDVRIVLTPSMGMPRYVDTTVVPVYLDIIFEPQTHVPFFYEGRALPSIGSAVNATALVDTGSFLDGDLVYHWRVNQKVLEQGPIRGRNKVSFEMPMGRKSAVYLQVSRPSGEVIARRAVYIPSVYPQMTFYEENALYGPSNLALQNNVYLTGNNFTFLAEPYYLDSRVFNNPDIVEWEIENSETVNPNNNPYRMVIQKTGEGARDENISFRVGSLDQVLQGVEGGISVSY